MSSIFGGGGSGSRKAAKKKGDDAIITGGNFSGAGGSGGFDFSNGQTTLNTELGPLQGMFDQLLQTSQGGLDQAAGGLPPELMQLLQGSIQGLGENSAGSDPQFQGLGSIFQNSLQTANADPFELGGGVADKLRALSERKNQRDVANTFDRLKASGKLGTTGGAGIAGELDANIQEQGLKFDLAGLQAGQGLQQDAFGRAMGSAQGMEGILGRQAGNIGQQANIGLGGFQSFLQNQAQGANIGFGAGQLAGQTSQIPLQFMQALLASGGQASNSLLGSAGVDQNNAQMQLEESGQMFDFLGNLAGGALAGR